MQNQKHAEERVGVYSKVKNIKEDGVEDVYCLSVPTYKNFLVNNGILVKNCLDALRYSIFSHFFNKSENKIDWGKTYRETMGSEPELPRFFRSDYNNL